MASCHLGLHHGVPGALLLLPVESMRRRGGGPSALQCVLMGLGSWQGQGTSPRGPRRSSPNCRECGLQEQAPPFDQHLHEDRLQGGTLHDTGPRTAVREP